MNPIVNEIKSRFQKGDILTRLIILNGIVFLASVFIIGIIGLFSNYTPSQIENELLDIFATPVNNLDKLPFRFYTIVTSMFFHLSLSHILGNMLMLYFLGKVFLSYFSSRNLLGLYILGGLIGIVSLILIAEVSPKINVNYGLGASAGIMAIVVGICAYAPNSEIRLFGVFPLKMMYLGIGIVLLDFIFLLQENTGGHIAHIGGAFTGLYFSMYFKKGRDITKGINRIIDKLSGLFKRRSNLKVVHSQEKVRRMSDEDYNASQKTTQAEIDIILDKISASGYESLNKTEKEILFKYSNK